MKDGVSVRTRARAAKRQRASRVVGRTSLITMPSASPVVRVLASLGSPVELAQRDPRVIRPGRREPGARCTDPARNRAQSADPPTGRCCILGMVATRLEPVTSGISES